MQIFIELFQSGKALRAACTRELTRQQKHADAAIYRFGLPRERQMKARHGAETVYRSISMFLLARELAGAGGAQGFAALEELYENLHIVNRGMSRRLGAATRTDPAQNPMALLAAYTTLFPPPLPSSLQDLNPLSHAS